MTTLKQLVVRQYRTTVDAASERWLRALAPKEGWLRTSRKALAMTLEQVAARTGTSRASVAQMEKAELSGAVTLKAMRRMAAAMGCEFVYAVVPPAPVLDVLTVQAQKQARVELARAAEQLSLDGQVLTAEQIEKEMERLVQEKLVNLSPRLWDES
jgi:predicted DNA-binding mobile mystery protein A